MLLYNPATERRNGTTHSFFATIAGMPPNAPPRPVGRGHRHSSAAINYWFQGAGKSIVMGETVEWGEGDLMLSAPGWAEHAHYPGPTGMAVLTIQDHPLQIGMESLIWQEDMSGPILTLGSEAGVTGYTGPRQLGA
jgi:gentisate 1,2-dioxygenase